MASNLISCPYPVGYYYRQDPDTGLIERHPKGCGKWDCPYCGERKKAKLLNRLSSYYSAHLDEARMLTLTLRDTHDDANDIMECWNRLRSSLKKYGIRLVYFWMKEFTKKGKRHLHIMINRFIPKVLLEKLWHLATGDSWKVHISKARLRSPAGYMMKYVTKDIQHEHRFRRRERRYGFSRDFAIEKMTPTGEWSFQVDRASYQQAKTRSIRLGLEARGAMTREILHLDPPPEILQLRAAVRLYQEIRTE